MRKSILSCALILLFSVVMLFGTTYAWFSDELVVEDNVVTLGKFDMEVTYGDPTNKDTAGNVIFYEFTPARHLYEAVKDSDKVYIQPGSVLSRQVKIENKGQIDMAVRVFFTGGSFLGYNVKFGETVLGPDNYVLVKAGESVVIDTTVTVPTHLDNNYINLSEYFDFYVKAEQYIRVADKVVNPL